MDLEVLLVCLRPHLLASHVFCATYRTHSCNSAHPFPWYYNCIVVGIGLAHFAAAAAPKRFLIHLSGIIGDGETTGILAEYCGTAMFSAWQNR